ncbi:DUF6541 family protein [Rothia nasimurium]|uniref:DUF6541 family protein n=1 Tax=Rothia nasimurium TaxID=85336 RepID=UPI001F1EB8B0|nr:DUF6541 family protein [Rothia nasimurium]
MQWVEVVPWVVFGLGVTLVPGYCVAWILRFGPALRVALAPVFSFGLLGIAAAILGALSARWSVTSYLLVSVAVIVALCIFRLVLGVSHSGKEIGHKGSLLNTFVYPLVGFLISSFLLITQLIKIIGYPEAFSQSYDNIFHLNAIRWIFDSGDASSFHLGGMITPDGSPSFYPASWHGLAALIFSFFGGSPTVSANVVTIVIVGFLWPLSMWALAAILIPERPLFIAATVMTSGVVISYPGLMLKWGILYPNMLGYAILPGFLAVLILCVQSVENLQYGNLVFLIPSVILSGVALGFAHPNAVTAAAVFMIPVICAMFVRGFSLNEMSGRINIAFSAVSFIACLVIWWKVRPDSANSTWGPTLTDGHAVGEFLTNSYNQNSSQWLLFVLTVIGIVNIFRSKKMRTIAVSWVLIGFLYVVVSSWDADNSLRMLLTGPWYNDKYRIAALSSIPVSIIGGYGFYVVIDSFARKITRIFKSKSRRGVVSVSFVLLVIGGWALGSSESLNNANISAHREFTVLPDSLLLTSDELKVLDVLPDYVQPGEEVLVDPWEGAALAYAFDDIPVTLRHSLSSYAEPYDALYLHLNDLSNNPEVCQEVHESGVYWYLDFEDTLAIGEHWQEAYVGLVDVIETDYVQAVYTSGNVGLYRIVGCD